MKKIIVVSIVCVIFLLSNLTSFAELSFTYPHGVWTYEGGELVSTPDDGHYVAEFANTSELSDFEITYEMYVHDWPGWHGLNFRREDSTLQSWATGYTVQMFHGATPATLLKGTTAVATGSEVNPWIWGEWTKVNVVVEGSNLTVYVNDQETPVLTYDSLEIDKGALAFTTEASNGITIKNVDLTINDVVESQVDSSTVSSSDDQQSNTDNSTDNSTDISDDDDNDTPGDNGVNSLAIIVILISVGFISFSILRKRIYN